MHQDMGKDVEKSNIKLCLPETIKFQKRLDALKYKNELLRDPVKLDILDSLSEALQWHIILIKDNAELEAEFGEKLRSRRSRQLSTIAGLKSLIIPSTLKDEYTDNGGHSIPILSVVGDLDEDSLPKRMGCVAYAG